MDILAILVLLILACVLFWGVNAILAAFGVGDPVATVVRVLLVVVMVVAVLGQLGYGTPILIRPT